jgi:hypothetical protein
MSLQPPHKQWLFLVRKRRRGEEGKGRRNKVGMGSVRKNLLIFFFLGSGFSTSSSTVTFTCLTPTPATLTTVLSVAVNARTATLYNITITSGTGYLDFSVCTLRLTNADGNFAELHGITTKKISTSMKKSKFVFYLILDNLGIPLVTGNLMNRNRRRFTLLSAKIPTVSKTALYAIGSDVSNSDGASIEYSLLDNFGRFTYSWKLLSQNFPFPISKHSADVCQNMIYVVGGDNAGNGAGQRTVFRSEILDPADAPVVSYSISVNYSKFVANVAANPNPLLATDFNAGKIQPKKFSLIFFKEFGTIVFPPFIRVPTAAILPEKVSQVTRLPFQFLRSLESQFSSNGIPTHVLLSTTSTEAPPRTPLLFN